MPSVDFCQLSQTSQSGFRSYSGGWQTSPGKNAVFLSIYPPHLLPESFGSKDFVLVVDSSTFKEPYMRFVFLRPEICRRLFFRFHLAVDTLALSMVTTAFTIRDFHLRETAPMPGALFEEPRLSLGSVLFAWSLLIPAVLIPS